MRYTFSILLFTFFSSAFAQQYPFSHGFATDISGQVPAGWTGDIPVKSYHGLDDGKGLAAKVGSTNDVDSIVSPLIGPITQYSDLIFWYRVIDEFIYPSSPTLTSDMGSMEVYAMTDDTTGVLITTINGSNHIPQLDFFRVEVPLTSITGQNIRLKFRCSYGSGAAYNYDIDSVRVRDGLTPNSVESETTEQLQIYPNPATDYIHVTLAEFTGNAGLSVYSLTGQLMINETISYNAHNTINIDNLPPAFYLVQIKSGNKYYIGKFAITR